MSRLQFFTILCMFAELESASDFGEIIYAINAHGPTYTDSCDKDPLQGRMCTASDYVKQKAMTGPVNPGDEILYRTERNKYGYDIPANKDGDYVLVLKFSKVYHIDPNMNVFDVVLNGDHSVVADLDIFDKVVRGDAQDVYIYIPYLIKHAKLYYNEEVSDIREGKIKVEFIKGYKDNPKINALYVMRGTIDEVSKLTPPVWSEGKESNNEVDEKGSKSRHASGPKQPDPYSMDVSSVLMPVFITVGAFVPLLFYICML